MSWAELSWAELSWAELSWAELSWAELSLSWNGHSDAANSMHCNSSTIARLLCMQIMHFMANQSCSQFDVSGWRRPAKPFNYEIKWGDSSQKDLPIARASIA